MKSGKNYKKNKRIQLQGGIGGILINYLKGDPIGTFKIN